MADRITPYGFVLFIVGLFLENSVLMRPALVAKVAGADLWLALALGAVPVSAVALLVTWLGELFPEQTFVEYARRVWGRWLGTALVVIVLAYWVAKTAEAALVMRRVVSLTLLPRTPDWVLIGVELLATAYLAWQGVGPAVRMAEFVVVPALVALVAAMALALPMTDLGRLR
ncbi:MAG: GerAB/ArcD/ProY family transporter, partial [Chitinophagales bacterium]